MSNADPSPQVAGHIYRKLDELGAMHQRTREDVVEIKAAVKGVAEAQARVETRQKDFEFDVDRRFGEHRHHVDAEIGKITSRLTTIHEERIAEKAQWRGPEKVIAALAGIASAIAAIAAIRGFLF